MAHSAQHVFLALVIAAVAVGLAPADALPQVTLEDALVRSFDITADLRPVPFAGVCDADDVTSCRITAFGTLRGRTVATIEVTSATPVSALRFFIDPDLTLKAVTGPPLSVRKEREHVALLTFTPPLQPRSTHRLTFEYEGKPFLVWDEFILVSEGTLYPALISPFGDLVVNRAPLRITVTTEAGVLLASSGAASRQASGSTVTYRWEVKEPLPVPTPR